MLQRAQMTDGGLAFWVVSPGNDALWGAAASLSSRCWAGRRIHLQLLPHVTAKPLSSSPRAWTNALTLHFPLTKRDIYWRQRLLFSIFLLLLNRHQHQEQNWAGWLFTFRICTLTSRLCFMSKKKKKCLSFSLTLHQMLGFGRKELDLENFSHFSLNSFSFCFIQNSS